MGATIASIFVPRPVLNNGVPVLRNGQRLLTVTTAVTSTTSRTFRTFLNPSLISLENGGVNGRNMAWIFHEALHGFGGATNRFYDQHLMNPSVFNLTGSSSAITDHIQRHCFN